MAENNRVRENANRHDENNVSNKIFSLVTLIIDILIVHVKVWYYVFESIYLVLFPAQKVSVRNEIVLITGAAHGIGKELALQYAQKGAKVVCWDINEKGNKETVDAIKSQGGFGYSYVCDVTKRESILEIAEKVKEDVGRVSILVNNAGIMPCHPFLKHSEKEIRTLFDINVLAHFWLLQAFLPDMIEANHGHIVSLSSCAGLFGIKNLVPYCGTKFAVRGYMQSLAEELRKDERNLEIKFTTIYPYMVDTGLCKKPHMRFENLMKLVKVEEAATEIISAQRRGIQEYAIPNRYLRFEGLGRLLPRHSMNAVTDFLDSGVNSDL